MADQYSDLNVKGKITQKAAQGTSTDDVVKYPTLTTRVPATLPTPSAGTAGQAVIINANGDGYTTGEAGKVDDVQINGTTIVSSKIANIPKAASDTLGVIKVGSNLSIDANGVLSGTAAANNGKLTIQDGQSTAVKAVEFTADQSGDTTLTVTGSDGTTVTGDATNHKLTVSSPSLGTGASNAAYGNHTHGNITTDGKISSNKGSIVTTNSSTGAIEASGKTIKTNKANVTTSATTTVPTSAAVAGAISDAIDALPEPMLFKGTVGTNGTITSLPAASSSNEGFTYKAITDHAASTSPAYPAYKAGDTLISTGSEWVVVPSGDEPSGTVTSVAAGTGLTTDQTNAGPITSSGTISLADTAVTAGSYGPTQTSATTLAYSGSFKVPKYTVDAQGRLTASGDIQFTLPASDNTDSKVQQKGITTSGEYPILLKYDTGTSDVSANYVNFAKPTSKVPTINPNTGAITAAGGFVGNASTATNVAYTGITSNPFATEDVTLADM